MSRSLINYPAMLQRALLSLVRDVLTDTADVGLPGDHHLYIAFDTGHPGVDIPAFLRERYEEEMTVVLQNQFWDLETDDDGFSVTLRFDGTPARLQVPYEAIRSFVDPTASFGLKFELAHVDDESDGAEDDGESSVAEASTPSYEGQVLSFDRTRSRN